MKDSGALEVIHRPSAQVEDEYAKRAKAMPGCTEYVFCPGCDAISSFLTRDCCIWRHVYRRWRQVSSDIPSTLVLKYV